MAVPFKKILKLFDSTPDLEAVSLRTGLPPRLLTRGQLVALASPALSQEELNAIVLEIAAPPDLSAANGHGFVAFPHPTRPLTLVVERREGGYEIWIFRRLQPIENMHDDI